MPLLQPRELCNWNNHTYAEIQGTEISSRRVAGPCESSSEGQGTTFRVRIPAESVLAARELPAAEGAALAG